MADLQTYGQDSGLKHTLLRGLLYLVLILFSIYYLFPLFVMITTSLKSLTEIREGSLISLPRVVTFDAWNYAWNEACVGVECSGIKTFFWNSVQMAIPAVLISTILGALNGYALTKFRFKGANIVFAMLLFGCFVPFQVVLLPMSVTLGKLGIANSTMGLVLVHVVYGLCFTTLFFRNYYVSIPDELVKAATIDGAGFFTIFWRIILPISGPIIVVSIIWQFTQIWNDFLFGASFSSGGSAPMTVALNNIVNTTTGVKQYNVDMASALLTGLPTLLVYVLAGKYFVRGLTAGSVKG
ncbi:MULTISPECIES: carbohydrate ABC transporter permease [unclassified Thalassospira]|jgi:glucose/mannose transport system permease protein|uniref:carbohydrate ABC transporter permease n=1 Tax=unclassified Thalassospira TaxID=2648997 RepID=UPI000A1F8F72|nr:carbohydrate ABC transporter permease [Thalassospira sp. MCCC 1A01428]OSQ42386.1 sugar ABC transporter permease [Thalassospira sp. MCCC 1A01428]